MKYNFIIDENVSGEAWEDSLELIDSFFDKEEIQIHDCNITNKELSYIFVIGVRGYPSHCLNSVTKQKNPDWPTNKNGQIEIPKSIIDKYHSGFKISFFIFSTDECDNPDTVEIFSDYMDYLNINQKHLYLSTGNELLSKNKKEYNSEINVNTNKILLSKISNVIDSNTDYTFTDSRDKLFQCYNNMLKSHRLGIYTFFNKENLIDTVDLSLLEHQSFDWNNEYMFLDVLDNKFETTKEWHEIASKSIKNKISLKSEFEIHNTNNKTGKQTYSTALHEVAMKQNLFKHTYINIVTESKWNEKNTIHITEKSIVPFFFHQIPIIIAPPNHIQTMKNIWGLDFFDDIINHDYDSIQNHQLRFKAITEEILRLTEIENKIIDFFKNNKDRFEKNKKIIANIKNSNKDKIFWKSLTHIE